MDDYLIDNHKLLYHPKRVLDWLKRGDVYPLYIEISPSSVCNHRCIFCAFDYLGHKGICLGAKPLKDFLKEISGKGVKSVLFSGEGEPFLHRGLPGIIRYAKTCGLDVAVTTNGALLSKKILEEIIPCLSWLRFSLNAGTPGTYAKVHRAAPGDFNKAIQNIKEAVRLKKKNKHSCTVGAQLLLLNENYKEVNKLAGILRGIGADYLIIKPYSQHPLSINRLKPLLDYARLLYLEKRLKAQEDKNFKIIFRKKTILKLREKKPYKKCLGFPFYAHLTTEGDLYACSSFLGDRRFCYGNIYKDSFGKIWKGARRKKFLKMMDSCWDIAACREACRLDEINSYLWGLRHPPEHVNFI